MGTKNRNRRIADFFLLYHYPFRVLFSTYYTKLSFVVVKKYDNTNNKDNISISKKCCPRLSLVVVKKNHDNIDNKDNISILFQKCCPKLTLVVVKKTRQHKQQRQHFFLIPKVLSKVVPRCRQKNTTTQTTKTTFLSYSKKCCPKLSLVVVKKITTTQTTKTTFLSYSKNVVQSCPSLSSKKSSFHENIYLCLRKY